MQEGIDSLAGYGRVFYSNVHAVRSGAADSLICGPCAGGAAYSPALTDFIIQTQQGAMFITGPQVIKQVTGEVVTAEELGGPQAQMNNSGVVHLVAAERRRGASSFAAGCSASCPPTILRIRRGCLSTAASESDPELNKLVPADNKVAYDVRDGGDARGGPPGFPRNSAGLCAQHRHRIWASAGPPGGNRRQPARRAWPARWISTPPTSRRALSASAMLSTFRW